MPKKHGEFCVNGVKTVQIQDFVIISVYFNDVIDTNSVFAKNICVNYKPLPPFTEFLFSKNHRMMRFSLPKNENSSENEVISLKITDFRSFDGRTLKDFEIKGLKIGEFYKRKDFSVPGYRPAVEMTGNTDRRPGAEMTGDTAL